MTSALNPYVHIVASGTTEGRISAGQKTFLSPDSFALEESDVFFFLPSFGFIFVARADSGFLASFPCGGSVPREAEGSGNSTKYSKVWRG